MAHVTPSTSQQAPHPARIFTHSANRPTPSQSSARGGGRGSSVCATGGGLRGGCGGGAHSAARQLRVQSDAPHRSAIRLPPLSNLGQSVPCGVISRVLQVDETPLTAPESENVLLTEDEQHFLDNLVATLKRLPSVVSDFLDEPNRQEEQRLIQQHAHSIFETFWNLNKWDSLLATSKIRDKLVRLAKSFLVRTDFLYSPHE